MGDSGIFDYVQGDARVSDQQAICDRMNEPAFLSRIACETKAVMGLGLAVVLGVWALTSDAAQTGAAFRVTVNLQTGLEPPGTEFCTLIGAFAASVTVSCPADRVRFVTHPPLADQLPSGESNVEAGIVTSWRQIRVGDKDYLEMTVRW